MKTSAFYVIMAAMLMALTGCESMISFNRKDGSEMEDVETSEAAEKVSSEESTVDQGQLTQTIDDKKAELKKYNKLVVKLKRYEEQLKAEKSNLKQEVDTLREKQVEIKQQTNKLVEKQQREKAKQQAEKAKTSELEKVNDKLITQNKIMLKHLEDAKKTAATLEVNRKREEKVLADLKQQIGRNKKELTSMILEQKSLYANIKKLKVEKAKLEAMSTNFASTKAKLQQNIQQLQQTISGFENWKLFADQKVAAQTKPAKPAKPAPKAPPVKSNAVKLYPKADSFLLQKASDKNMGPHNGLAVGKASNYGELLSIMKFDLNKIPQNRKVKKVTLHCYCNNHTGSLPEEVVVHQVTAPWKENSINWSNVQFSKGPLAGTVFKAAKKWYEWDITPLYDQWRRSSNNGLVLKRGPESKNEENYFLIGSRESKAFAPFIEVELDK